MTAERGNTEDGGSRARPMSAKDFGRRLTVTAGFAILLYLFLRFALPAFLPLLFGWLISGLILPVACFLRKVFRLSEKLAPAAAFSLVFLLAGGMMYVGWLFVRKDLAEFACACPELCRRGSAGMAKVLAEAEGSLNLPAGMLGEKLETLGEDLCLRFVDFVSSAGESLAGFGVLLLFSVTAAYFWTKEGEALRRRTAEGLRRIPDHGAVLRIADRVAGMGKCFLRCECRVTALTCAICAGGLWLMRTPHAFSLGLLIGLLDTLPLLGTGTVLFPWAAFSFLTKRTGFGLGLIAICLACTLLRQGCETGCFGSSPGVTSLESLAAMYAGWKWLGLAGLFLGPLAWLLIREVWRESESIVKTGK